MKKNVNINMILLTIISSITLLIAVVGTTFVILTVINADNDDITALEVAIGTLGTEFIGGANINIQNIGPREEAWEVKTFSIHGSTDAEVYLVYNLSLIINENSFGSDNDRDNILEFSLTVDENSSNNGITLEPIQRMGIPRVGPVELGSGQFNGPITGSVVHTYHLSIYFPNRGFNQDEEQGKIFRARIQAQTK